MRHALPLRTTRVGERADPELSEAGHEQAQRLGDYLASEQFDALYSSPMQRARQTAAPLSGRLGIDVTVIDDLAEWGSEATEYIPVEELKAADDPRWFELRAGVMQDASEDLLAFSLRVANAVEALVDAHPAQRIAVVCHAMVINVYLSRVLGLADSAAFFAPNYTSIHRVAAARSGERSIVTLNETAHLRGSGLPIGLFQR